MKAPRIILRWTAAAAVVALAIGTIVWVMMPSPIAVEFGRVTRGPMEVTVEQLGEVRVHDRFDVTAPVAGKLLRVELHQGDEVRRGEVVATLFTAPLDPRQRDEAAARLSAANGLEREAAAALEKTRVELALASRDRERMDVLLSQDSTSAQEADRARTAEASARRLVAAAEARLEAARADVRAAQAALIGADKARPGDRIALTAPVSGRVLRLIEQSEHTLPAGTVIMVVGDPRRFEIVADVLSTDAVRIKPGAVARIGRWGGERTIQAQVRTVEPYAFTKISALGVEEKRVNIIMDPIDPIEPLGDGYRVEASIVEWSSPSVLRVPASALFRKGSDWGVFVVSSGRARLRLVKVEERNPREAAVAAGLAEGDLVVQYPPNTLREGMRVRDMAR